MSDMSLFALSAGRPLAEGIARPLAIPLGGAEERDFEASAAMHGGGSLRAVLEA